MTKKILDACCGGRMFWFDKKNPNAMFIDSRRVKPVSIGKGKNARMYECSPDKVMDFRKMGFKNNTFSLVVFDPPHFTMSGNNSWTKLKYGRLDKKTWREDLKKGFKECLRVLKPDGVLIFKWNEYQISIGEVLALAPIKPLFGHRSGKASKTHWLCFMKLK